ncbi:GerMN domain-containing protein [Motilibacter deserti]|uniref:GerMN domain-containing protein n=1 Tax=Motilibacter deserti TaxID=2714956 RepID=A0ABX0GXU6_9ACTN|nr:GerMN domain-containing protein [Motilibacter deserti]NHC15652.1 GerMN domain-containing protein [Motilibacter deserti]
MRGRRSAALLVAVTLAGCGVREASTPAYVDPAAVPYGLLGSAAPTSTVTGTGELLGGGPAVYFVRDGRLEPTPAPPRSGTGLDQLDQLLDALAAGPPAAQQRRSIGTALPPGVSLRVVGVRAGVATVELAGDPTGSDVDQAPLAVAQIVFTVTSLRGAESVLLTRDGDRLSAPLPDGSLVDRELTAADYATVGG